MKIALKVDTIPNFLLDPEDKFLAYFSKFEWSLKTNHRIEDDTLY